MNLCDDCQKGTRLVADGHWLKDWSGQDTSETNLAKLWTYQECSLNKKGLKYINLVGDCPQFKAKK